ncbi:MAG: response regulator transcription factor [Gallionellaceae bacterium]|nr:response regulator transcription factor [Gallionellaceae bacterium]
MKYSISVVKVEQAHSLMLASPSMRKLDRWKQGLNGYARLLHIQNLDSLRDEVVQVKPEILLLDYELPQLDGARGIVRLRRLSPHTKIVMMSGSISDEEEWAFFRAGARGCCRDDISLESLQTLVAAVQQGELWIRRTLTYRLLEQMGGASNKKIDRTYLGLLASLTQREYEISVRVSIGENNKQIAQALKITERTVKSHLTEIYRKLGDVDRLKLALILSGDERQVRRGVVG